MKLLQVKDQMLLKFIYLDHYAILISMTNDNIKLKDRCEKGLLIGYDDESPALYMELYIYMPELKL